MNTVANKTRMLNFLVLWLLMSKYPTTIGQLSLLDFRMVNIIKEKCKQVSHEDYRNGANARVL